MIPVLYEKDRKTFTDNGLGGLPHALACLVTREANTGGGYFLDMEYPVEGLHFNELQEERIIHAAPAPGKAPQPFRISRITRDGKTALIHAPHVSEDLSSIITWGSFIIYTPQGGFNNYKSKAEEIGQSVPFYFSSDVGFSEPKNLSFPQPTSLMNTLLGESGSLLDTVGGEFEFDAWHVILHKQMGKDTGVEIRTGANIIGVRAETDNSTLVTAVLPYFKGSRDGQDVYVYGSICRSATAGNYQNLRCVPLDVSGNFSGLTDGTLPTAAQVTAQGQAFINSASSSVLRTSYEVEYIPTPPALSGITPAPTRNLYLFDRASVVLPEYGVRAAAKVVKTVHNVLLDRYNSVTIGTIQRNAADTIAALIRQTGTQRILW